MARGFRFQRSPGLKEATAWFAVHRRTVECRPRDGFQLKPPSPEFGLGNASGYWKRAAWPESGWLTTLHEGSSAPSRPKSRWVPLRRGFPFTIRVGISASRVTSAAAGRYRVKIMRPIQAFVAALPVSEVLNQNAWKVSAMPFSCSIHSSTSGPGARLRPPARSGAAQHEVALQGAIVLDRISRDLTPFDTLFLELGPLLNAVARPVVAPEK